MKLKVKKILQDLQDYVESEEPMNHIVFSMNQTLGSVDNRIFNSEKGAQSISGAGLGKYSNSYAKFRRSYTPPRQANVVDLELTGSLRRDLKVVRDGNVVLMSIVSDTERKIAGHLEKKYKKNIFGVSKSEREQFYSVLLELFSQDLQNIIDGES